MKSYSQSVIAISKDSESFLAFYLKMHSVLDELNLMHSLVFAKLHQDKSGLLFFQNCVPSTSFLMNSIYAILSSNHFLTVHSDLLRYIFEKTIKPFLNALSSAIFRGEEPEMSEFCLKLNETKEKFQITKEEAVPHFIAHMIQEILLVANNLLILQNKERDYFQICKEELNLEIIFDPDQIKEYKMKLYKKFDIRDAYLKQKSYDLRIEDEKMAYEKMQKKLEYLKKVKEVS